MKNTSSSDRVWIFDTTLRDGEQSPGASLNHRDKLEIARQLALLNVDVIEAGFPIASPDDFRAVKAIAETVKGPVICGLARCVEADIDRCAEAVAPARRPRIHVFLATSAIHRKFKLRKARSEILAQAVAHVAYAKRYCEDVEFSPEDASRTEPDFLAQVVEAVVDAGATVVNIPDTVGYAVPSEFGALVAYLFDKVPALRRRAMLSVHCHNDLGLAVANSLAAVQNGARCVECTINGLGERAGNAALEEVVMALRTRAGLFGTRTAISTRDLVPTSRMVSRLTGLSVQRNKAVVGANAFAHEAGVHQDGVLKERTTYEIMRPEDVGLRTTDLVLGKHSGRHGLKHRLGKLGIDVPEKAFEAFYARFLELADKKKQVYDDDLLMMSRDEAEDSGTAYGLESMQVTTGNRAVPTATVELRKGKAVMREAACGDGPVDAVLKAIDRMTGTNGRLVEFGIQAITVGQDAMGEATVGVAFGSHVVTSKAASTDIVEAAARAYLSCVNRHLSVAAMAARRAKK